VNVELGVCLPEQKGSSGAYLKEGSDMGLDTDRLLALEERLLRHEALINDLAGKLRALEASHSNTAVDHDVVVTCLDAKDVLTLRELNTARQSRRFSADVLQGPGLPETIGRIAGLRAFAFLTCTSRTHWACLKATLRSLASSSAPYFYLCGGSSLGGHAGALERCHPESKEREALPPMPTQRPWCEAVALGGFVYVLGGMDDLTGEKYACNDRFDPLSGGWEAMEPMNSARALFGIAAAYRRIQALGGLHSNADGADEAFAVVECFDPARNSWERLPDMSTPRAECAAAASPGFVYIAGGRDHAMTCYATVERLDVAAAQWEQLPDLPSRRFGCGAALCCDSFYVFGGQHTIAAPQGMECHDLAVVERFPLSTGSWEQVADMPSPRSSCSVVVASGHRLYVFGGPDGGVASCDLFLHSSETWAARISLPTSPWACSTAALHI